MRYQFIKEQQEHHAIEFLCDVMEVSRSGYYVFVTRPESKRETEDKRLQIKERPLKTAVAPMVIVGLPMSLMSNKKAAVSIV